MNQDKTMSKHYYSLLDAAFYKEEISHVGDVIPLRVIMRINLREKFGDFQKLSIVLTTTPKIIESIEFHFPLIDFLMGRFVAGIKRNTQIFKEPSRVLNDEDLMDSVKKAFESYVEHYKKGDYCYTYLSYNSES